MHHESTSVVKDYTPSRLDQVRSGMSVYDSTNEYIGDVSFVYLGSASQNELDRGEGPASEGTVDGQLDRNLNGLPDNSFVDLLADAFNTEEMPTELVERLRSNGFVRINSNGVFASDRFATADQIASVTEDEVHLTVTDEELATPE